MNNLDERLARITQVADVRKAFDDPQTKCAGALRINRSGLRRVRYEGRCPLPQEVAVRSKRFPTKALIFAALASFAGQRAQSQGYYQPRSAPLIQGQIMGGFSSTSGNTAQYLQGGWAIDAGFIYWPGTSASLGIRTDLSYSQHQATDQFLAFGQSVTGQEVDDGWGDFSAISTGLMLRAPLGSWAHLYGLAQVGLSHVNLRLAQTFFVAGFYCDPFFDYCDYPVVGDSTVYSYDTSRLSWNVGVGVDFASGWGRSWFIEAQYRRIETTPHAFEYWPVMVGLRF